MSRPSLLAVSLLAVGLGAISWQAMTLPAADPAEPPYGLAERVPLTTSRVVGAPEPPPPLKSVPAFAKLKFKNPLYVTLEPITGRVLVVEQAARILALPNSDDAAETTVFCEIPDHDAYSLYFHPKFAENRYVYIFANGKNSEKVKRNRILRYVVPQSDAPKCDMATETEIIAWESNGHNGGEMAIGPDGFLYITSGDGTSDSDTDLTGQNLTELLSGMIRIDIEHPDEGRHYSVPKDNPFLEIKDARPELWAYGFRNPWRMCFDPQTGDLWVGDIGQDQWEMVHVVQKGANYGWGVYEGGHPFYLERQFGPTPLVKPTIVHPHSEARSITGGIVYTGEKFPDLKGAYLYGDYATGKIWAARYQEGKITFHKEIADTQIQVLAFAQDAAGEILMIDYGGGLFRLETSSPTYDPAAFPRKLSETGLFLSVKDHVMQPGVVPYSVNSPLWSDGAYKERFLAVPETEQITFKEKEAWGFPERTVMVKTFSLEREAGKPETRRRIETRLMVVQQNEWVGYSYLWNEDQTDADLVEAAGLDRIYAITDPAAPDGRREQTWHYPSRAECMVCHSRAAAYVLGLTTAQMNRAHQYGEITDNQLRTLGHAGYLKDVPKEKPASEMPKLADPADPSAPLEDRARSYLFANCAQCHVNAGGGNSQFDLHFTKTREETKLVSVAPLHHKFDLPDPLLIAPGHPERSVLLYRVTKLGAGRMPPLASGIVDAEGAKLLTEWIKQLPETPAAEAPEKK